MYYSCVWYGSTGGCYWFSECWAFQLVPVVTISNPPSKAKNTTLCLVRTIAVM